MKKDYKIHAVEVNVYSNGIVINWTADIGFGEYELVKDGKWTGYSEYMDKGEDKTFLRDLLMAFADSVEVKE